MVVGDTTVESRWIAVVLVLPTANPPHAGAGELPVTAAFGITVKLTGELVAVPPAAELKVSHDATGLVVVSIVNGVPPLAPASDVTLIVCAGPCV